jgi:hypothetical protein
MNAQNTRSGGVIRLAQWSQELGEMYGGVRLAHGGVSSLSSLRSASDKFSGPLPASSCRYEKPPAHMTWGRRFIVGGADRPGVIASHLTAWPLYQSLLNLPAVENRA